MNRLNLTNTLKDEFSNKVYHNLATELASPKWKKKKIITEEAQTWVLVLSLPLTKQITSNN